MSQRPGPSLALALVGVGLVLVVLLGMWVGEQSVGSSPGPRRASDRPLSVERDQLAPWFSLLTTSGERVELDLLDGQVVLINFWATWCPPCREEMPVIEAAHQKYAARGFRVLAVNVRETSPEVVAYGRELGLTFPLLLDTTGEVATAYRVQTLPRSFFLARDGRVVRIHPGILTTETMENYLRELL